MSSAVLFSTLDEASPTHARPPWRASWPIRCSPSCATPGPTPTRMPPSASLKNETVGHVQKKEMWVELGVLEPVVKILASTPPSKPNGKEARRHPVSSRSLGEEEHAAAAGPRAAGHLC